MKRRRKVRLKRFFLPQQKLISYERKPEQQQDEEIKASYWPIGKMCYNQRINGKKEDKSRWRRCLLKESKTKKKWNKATETKWKFYYSHLFFVLTSHWVFRIQSEIFYNLCFLVYTFRLYSWMIMLPLSELKVGHTPNGRSTWKDWFSLLCVMI